ncbi:protein kinase [candidate division CSSED10-310 bacterium]|uniref:Protein kinase n=1 Tax=candidate division CSSED10-310 bacterium TaxID=2855610 RepID=A0ABV6YTD6_UNCC1
MINCPQCENQVKENTKFCPACGYNLSRTDTTAQETARFSSQETQAFPLTLGELTEVIETDKTLVDRYKLLEKIGAGGVSIVFKAYDLILNEIVAIKVLKPVFASDPTMIKRLVREVKLARSINHPNICRIFDLIFHDDIKVITMEFIDGVSLAKFLKTNEPAPFGKKLALVAGILSGLSAAHKARVIHRDLKPLNIMIDNHFRPVIMDFGISRRSGREKDSDITEKGEVIGTIDYMSPEQLMGHELDLRTDIYSLGVVLYELFTGVLPFVGETPFEMAMKHIESVPTPPRKINGQVTEKLEQCILKCLAKKPPDRYQTVDELISEMTSQPLLSPQKTGTKLILIAEDDRHIQKLLGKVLESADYSVIFANNGEEAIAQCFMYKPDLLSTDIMMPKMDGLQSIEFLTTHPALKDIPIIVVSGKADPDYIAYCKSLGVREYIVKPFDPFELVKIIQNILPV